MPHPAMHAAIKTIACFTRFGLQLALSNVATVMYSLSMGLAATHTCSNALPRLNVSFQKGLCSSEQVHRAAKPSCLQVGEQLAGLASLLGAQLAQRHVVHAREHALRGGRRRAGAHQHQAPRPAPAAAAQVARRAERGAGRLWCTQTPPFW